MGTDMVNEMLGQGGFLTARIPTRLREKEGISYGAGSFQNIPYDNQVAKWSVYAFFNPRVQEKVDTAIAEELKRAVDNGFTAEELKSNVGSWLNSRATSLGNDNALLSLINGSLYYNYSLDEWTKLESSVKALTTNDVNTVIKKYIQPDQLTLIYAGDFNKK